MSVIYASYPRSGNTMMRKWFENITGVATGSNLSLVHGLNIALQFTGFKAEALDGPSTWIHKSHYPMIFPFQKNSDLDHDIAVICTRYEVDVEPSFFLLFFTSTHVTTFKNKFTEEPILSPWLSF